MKRPLLALTAVSGLLLTACGASDPLSESSESGAIVVGSANFAENVLLGELYAQGLEDAGFEVDRTSNIGSREVLFGQVESCGLHVVPEYNQALLNFADPENGAVGADEVNELLEDALPEGTGFGTPSPAESNNALAVTAETAEAHGLAELADLGPVSGELTMGGPPEFETRWDGLVGLAEVYDIEFAGFNVLGDISGPITVSALNGGNVDVAMMQTASPAMAENDFVILDDTESVLGVNQVTPYYCSDALDDDALAVLDDIGAALTTEDLQQMNYEYSVENSDADLVVRTWLDEQDLS
ncbi:ABC transporter substrate-binding protein [Aeromicrobium sp. YIM 150415]|uniref:glycine betaine ABC transporter substrate-binding protein n=1 Tax=Aeromicrobium sp. YIM 150415 TaxID=2803912 RepID=UPI001963451C|nr:ABC transporter substrate-binding protein [Aeromicrobium sp. YIM 150415]MBM9462600.1 ABC transporter substrate-binding protein [Aeromicrobium sp. YIM 150415]